MLLPVTLGGTATLMLLDTGSDRSLLSADAAELLALPPANAAYFPALPSDAPQPDRPKPRAPPDATIPAAPLARGIGGAPPLGPGALAEVSLGQLNAGTVAIPSLAPTRPPDPARVAHLAGLPVVGLLGQDVLARYDLDLDLSARRLTLWQPSGNCAPDQAPLPLYTLPFRRGHNGVTAILAVGVRTGTAPPTLLRATLDTGAPVTALFLPAAHRAGLSDEAIAAGTPGATGGIGPARIATNRLTLPVLVLGGITLHQLPVSILAQDDVGDTELLLGLDIVRAVHVYVAASRHSVILRPPD